MRSALQALTESTILHHLFVTAERSEMQVGQLYDAVAVERGGHFCAFECKIFYDDVAVACREAVKHAGENEHPCKVGRTIDYF